MKTQFKVILQVLLAIAVYGFIGPALISYPSDLLVALGFGAVVGTLWYQGNVIYKSILKYTNYEKKS